MWYEILPSAFIIVAGIGLPGWGLYHCHKLVLGNHYRRSLLDYWDMRSVHRDIRLTGNPYTVKAYHLSCFIWTTSKKMKTCLLVGTLEPVIRFQEPKGEGLGEHS